MIVPAIQKFNSSYISYDFCDPKANSYAFLFTFKPKFFKAKLVLVVEVAGQIIPMGYWDGVFMVMLCFSDDMVLGLIYFTTFVMRSSRHNLWF